MNFKTILSAMLALGLAISAWSSEGVSEVLKLQQSGVSPDVMLTFVQTSKTNYSPTADEIQQLEDAGVPATVIVAMIDHGKDIAAGTTNTTTTTRTTTTTADVTPVAAVTEVIAPAPEEQNISYFYEELAPHGTWVNDPDYGWAWSPRV